MQLFEIFQAQKRTAVDVSPREVTRRFESVGVVIDVRSQHGDDFEDVLRGAVNGIDFRRRRACGAERESRAREGSVE
jgi:hypothetical protein